GCIATLDPTWIIELKTLIDLRRCAFIGSGYMQIAGPLGPAEVNAANQRSGMQVYIAQLGIRPSVAYVNEQAWSPRLVRHYLSAGYRGIVMEWESPAAGRPEWDPAMRRLPQVALGLGDEAIPVVWNSSTAFRRFQSFAYGRMECDEYLRSLSLDL